MIEARPFIFVVPLLSPRVLWLMMCKSGNNLLVITMSIVSARIVDVRHMAVTSLLMSAPYPRNPSIATNCYGKVVSTVEYRDH